MKRSLFTQYLRLETMGVPFLLGLGGAAFLIRAATDEGHARVYPIIAGALIVATAFLLIRAVRRL
jgi:hypothetical protein